MFVKIVIWPLSFVSLVYDRQLIVRDTEGSALARITGDFMQLLRDQNEALVHAQHPSSPINFLREYSWWSSLGVVIFLTVVVPGREA